MRKQALQLSITLVLAFTLLTMGTSAQGTNIDTEEPPQSWRNPKPNESSSPSFSSQAIFFEEYTTLLGGLLAWGDYDQDGDSDILIGCSGDGNAHIYENDPVGTFTEVQTLPCGYNIQGSSYPWADYDGDGDLDLGLPGRGASYIYKNNAGTFVSDTRSSLPIQYTGGAWFKWGDLDGISGPDLVISGTNYSRVYLNDGTGKLTQSQTLPSRDNHSADLGDYDQDGDLDLVSIGATPGGGGARHFEIYRNVGGTLSLEITLPGRLGDVHWVDYDGDGLLDIFIAGSTSLTVHQVELWRQGPIGTFTEDTSQAALDAFESLGPQTRNEGVSAWGDYDNDGDPDLFLSSPISGGCISKTYRNDPKGTLVEDSGTGINNLATCYYYPGWGDFDLDGDLDLVVWDQSAGAIIYRNVPDLQQPSVRSVTPCISGPYYFNPFPGSLANSYEARMDWQGLSPNYVDFILNGNLSQESASGNSVSHAYQLADDFQFGLLGARNELYVQAVAGSGQQSSRYSLYPIGIDPLPWLVIADMTVTAPKTCGYPMIVEWSRQYPEEPFEFSANPPEWFPFIGGKEFGIKPTQAGFDLKFKGNGSGSADLFGMTGFEVDQQEISGRVDGYGAGEIQVGSGIQLTEASFHLFLQGAVSASRPLVDVICKAFTGGTCPLKELESAPLIGGLIKWFNEIAVVKAELAPTIDTTLNFTGDEEGLKWQSGEGTGSLRITLSLIVEALEDLTAELYGGGEPAITLQVPAAPSYLKKLYAEIFAGLKFKYKRFEWPSGNGPLSASYEWSYEPGSSAAEMSFVQGSSHQFESLEWGPIPRTYTENPSQYASFVANQTLLTSGGIIPANGDDGVYSFTSEIPISTNVFPESHPSIASNGSTHLLWVHDDISKPLMQGEEIYYSTYNGISWSTPASITDDNLQDFAPQIAFDLNDTPIAIWERNKNLQSESSDFNSDYTNAFEIAYSTWNGSTWSNIALLTDNAVADHAFTLSRGNDGKLFLVWRQNDAGEIMGTATAPDRLMYSIWTGTDWAMPQILIEGVTNIIEMAAARHDDNTMGLIFSQDTDGDLLTKDDQELYSLIWDGSDWTGPTQITSDAQPDNHPTLFYDQTGSPSLLWLKGYSLYGSIGDIGMTPTEIAVEESAAILDYTASQDTDGNLVLLWQGYSEDGVDVFYAVYDESLDVFSLVTQLTHDEPLEKFMAPTFAPGGELVMAYNKTALILSDVVVSPEHTVENVTTFGQTDLYVLSHSFGTDLRLGEGDLDVDPTNPAPGDPAQLQATLNNDGEHAVQDPAVAFYLGDPEGGGTLIGTETATGILIGGDQTLVTLDWTLPSTDGPFEIYAVADPAELVIELNESNNSTSLILSVPDLVPDDLTADIGEGQEILLSAWISNDGVAQAPSSAIAFRLEDPKTGDQLAYETLASLVPDEEIQVQASWDVSSISNGKYKVYSIVDPDEGIFEADEENNVAWTGVCILPDLVIRPDYIESQFLSDGTYQMEVRVFNEGLRDVSGAEIGLYNQLPSVSILPITSATVDITAGASKMVILSLPGMAWSNLYIAANIEGEDCDPSDNVAYHYEPLEQIYLPIIFR